MYKAGLESVSPIHLIVFIVILKAKLILNQHSFETLDTYGLRLVIHYYLL